MPISPPVGESWVKEKKWIVKNNGEIIFTYAEPWAKFKTYRSTFFKSVSQLVEFGFIHIAHLSGRMMQDASKYVFSKRWREYGKK
jgi:hypothetical protein